MSSKFHFFDLFNWELRCLWEEQQTFEAIKNEDEAFLKQNKNIPFTKPQDTKAWLEAVTKDSPVQSVSLFCSAILKALKIVFFLMGASFCFSCLTQNPVDLSLALGLLLGLQLLLLMIVIFTMLFSKSSGPFGELLLSWSFRSPALQRWLQEKGLSMDALFNIFRRHQKVLKWQLSIWTQSLAVSFHLGLIFAFCSRVVFSDLKFIWNTSLPLPEHAVRLSSWIDLISTPWFWMTNATPNLDMLLATHQTWNLSEQRWWPWILTMLFFYGLIPRVCLFILSRLKADKHLQHDILTDSRVLMLKQRLNSIKLGWSESTTKKDIKTETSLPPSQPIQVESWVYVQLFDFPLSLTELSEITQKKLASRCSQLWVPQIEKTTISSNGAPEEATPWLCPIEDWQVPSKKIIRYFKSLRLVAGQERSIVIALCSTTQKPITEDRLKLWRAHCSQLQDPFLRVEALT